MGNNVAIGRDMPEDNDTNESIAKDLGMSVIDLSNVSVARDVVERLTAEFARRYRVLPLSQTDETVTVAIADPLDFDTLDSLRYALNQNVEVVYCNPTSLMAAIDQYYGDGT